MDYKIILIVLLVVFSLFGLIKDKVNTKDEVDMNSKDGGGVGFLIFVASLPVIFIIYVFYKIFKYFVKKLIS
jgi:hypothetical protein